MCPLQWPWDLSGHYCTSLSYKKTSYKTAEKHISIILCGGRKQNWAVGFVGN